MASQDIVENDANMMDDIDQNQTIEFRIMMGNSYVGSVIGKGGEVIKNIRSESDARINIFDSSPSMEERVVLIKGAVENVQRAVELIFNSLEVGKQSQSVDSFLARVPITNDQAGPIIGNGGETISDLREQSGARIDVSKKNNPPQDAPWLIMHGKLRIVTVSGHLDSVRKALQLICTILACNPPANAGLFTSFDHSTSRSSMGMGMGSMGMMNNMNMGMNMGGQGFQQQQQYGYPQQSGPILHKPHQNRGNFDGFSPYDTQRTLQMPIPESAVGPIIGRQGRVINEIRMISGCKVDVANISEDGATRNVTLSGTQSAVEKARLLIQRKMTEALTNQQ